MATMEYNVFVGSETGLLKAANCAQEKWNNLNTLGDVKKDNEICCMCWGSSQQEKVYFAQRSQLIKVYNILSGEICEEIELNAGEGKFKNIAVFGQQILTALDSGILNLWNNKGESELEIKTGDKLSCMRQNFFKHNLVATGGKENPLKLWDINKPTKPIFTSKNVPHDWLNLRVPIHVMSIDFIPKSEKIVTGTGYHQVRVYDPSTYQRRPVLNVTFDEYPITALTVCPNGNQVIVGNTQGNMTKIDLRKGNEACRYKGFAGGIKDLQCHPTLPYVASCSLDRFLRIHHMDLKHIMHKFYMKSRLNCLLLSKKWPTIDDEEGSPTDVSKDEVDDMSDALWDKLPVLGSKEQLPSSKMQKTKKRKLATKELPKQKMKKSVC